MNFKIEGTTGEKFAKRMLKIAWDASSCAGMGFMQDRREQDEDSVWKAMTGGEDYAGLRKPESGKILADSVFGRMMKFHATYGLDFIESHERPYRHDYESFCWKYPNFIALASATATELGVKITLQ